MEKNIENRKNLIISEVEENLKAFKKTIDLAEDDTSIILHQDAFAADYQLSEIFLLGSVIKYAGIKGIELRIIGKNRETLFNNINANRLQKNK